MRIPTVFDHLVFIAVCFSGIGVLHFVDLFYSIDGVRFSRTHYGGVIGVTLYLLAFLNMVALFIRINIDRLRRRGIERMYRENRLDLESLNPVHRNLFQDAYAVVPRWQVIVVSVVLALFLIPVVLLGGMILLMKVFPPTKENQRGSPAIEQTR